MSAREEYLQRLGDLLANARAEGAQAERVRWSVMLGYGNDVTEPAVTVKDFEPVWEDVKFAAECHVDCPQWCDMCDQWEKPRSCGQCNGSGCGPGTALGAYDPCEYCAGDGRDHNE